MRGDDQGQGQRRQHRFLQLLREIHAVMNVRQRREHGVQHGQKQNQNIGDKELRAGDRGQGADVGDAVENRVAVQRRKNTNQKRQRHGDGGRDRSKEQGVREAWCDLVGDGAEIGRRGGAAIGREVRLGKTGAEVKLHDPDQPVEITGVDGLVEAEVLADGGYCLGRCRLAEKGLGKVARQHVDRQKDDDRHHEHGEHAKAETLADDHCYVIHLRPTLGKW